MKALLVFIVVVHPGTFFVTAQNVGIGMATPLGKLHIQSQATQSQLVLDAAPAQGNFPRIILRNNAGVEQVHLRADNHNNLFLGIHAGASITSPFFPGFPNLGIGFTALQYNQSGYDNTAVGGHSALQSNIDGIRNTAIGSNALRFSNASFNTAVGAAAMYENTSGNQNTAMGTFSLQNNFSGNENTAVGTSALYSNYGSHYNTAVGFECLYTTTGSGIYNVALGHRALYNNSNGARNIAVGAGTGTNGPSFGNTISIGNHNYLQAASNQAFLGNLNIAWTGGNVGWSTFSDARIKTQITEDVKGLSFIMKLRPVTYFRSTQAALDITGNKDDGLHYEGKHDIEKIMFSGFLAQEVEKAAKESGYDFQGVHNPKDSRQLYSLSYETFVVPLVKAVQEQQAHIELLKEENKDLKTRLERLEKHLR